VIKHPGAREGPTPTSASIIGPPLSSRSYGDDPLLRRRRHSRLLPLRRRLDARHRNGDVSLAPDAGNVAIAIP